MSRRDGAARWLQKGHEALALAHSADYAWEATSDREEAVAAFDRAVNLDPDHADAWFLKSSLLELQLDFGPARFRLAAVLAGDFGA